MASDTPGLASHGDGRPTLRISGATVIDGTGRTPMTNIVLDVAGDRIAALVPTRQTPENGASSVFDGHGRTIVPGLIDGHIHVALLPENFADAADPDAVLDRLRRHLIGHGVTSVRDTGSTNTGAFFQELRAGSSGWPRFFGAGPVLDGPPGARWAGTRVLADPDLARPNVEDLASAGASLIKLYKFAGRELAERVVEAAHAAGLPVTAHVGRLSTAEAVRAGVDALEHVLQGPELLADTDRALAMSLEASGFDSGASMRLWQEVDPASDRARASIDLLVEHDVFLVPTLVLSQAILLGHDPELAERLGEEAMPAEVRERWRRTVHEPSARERAAGPDLLRRQLEFVALAHAAGVRIAAGTDGLGHHLVPGASLHEEVRLLVEAGLSPLEAIAAATGRNAELLGQEQDLGTLEPGRYADFVVLRSDPLASLGALRDIEAVVMGGQVVDGALSPLAAPSTAPS